MHCREADRRSENFQVCYKGTFTYMLSALSGIRPQEDDFTDRLRDQDSDTDKGEGVLSPKQFVDVIC